MAPEPYKINNVINIAGPRLGTFRVFWSVAQWI